MLELTVRQASLALLGGWRLTIDDQPAAVPAYDKGRAVLAYLAAEPNHWHSREKLGELLWPDAMGQRANFRQVLSNLRAVLSDKDAGSPIILTRRDAVRLNPDGPLKLDVAEFLESTPECAHASTPNNCADCIAGMEQMAALYQGEFIAEFSLPECPEFENWLQFKREAYHRRALALLETLSDCHEQMGQLRQAITFAQRLIELEPWQESGQRRLMRLHALSGQPSTAIAQYQACRTQLWKNLGVYPSETTQSLYQRINRGEIQPSAVAVKTIAPLPALAAERRQVTVLYCELTIAEAEDPDDAVERLRTPQTLGAAIIEKRGGHIVQSHGGGLLAYFGYPVAHEDTARQAVSAALSIRANAQPATVRIGIHSGLIVTSPDRSMPDTVGQTSDLAIRLRLLAGDDEIVLSQTSHALTGGYFCYSSLGAHALLGPNRWLEVYRVEGETGVSSRLEAATQLTPWVGRESEIACLLALWHEAKQGVRRAVLIRGEAGIGKSRLLHTLQERLSGAAYGLHELRCFPEFSHSLFYPIIVLLESLMGFAPGDAITAKLSKLTNYLSAHHPQIAAALLAPLLSLAQTETGEALPPKQKEKTLAVLLDLLHGLAARQPVLLILEDLHWIDPSSLELLALWVKAKRNAPILAVFTARPEFQPPWQKSQGVTLDLPPLADTEMLKLLEHWGANIAPESIKRIVARADGIPLFAEEMANMPAQSEAHHPAPSIPLTLHDILAARLDRTGKAKRTAQLAATLGREFSLELLRKVSSLDPAALDHALQDLQQTGLLLPKHAPILQFKHALIQEAAYQSQTKSDRQAAHLRIAKILQNHYPELAHTQPEIFAQHCSAAGENESAIDYWIRAGQRAARHSANREAIAHFTAGLQLLEKLAQNQTRDRLEFTLCVNLGAAQSASKGYGAIEAAQAYARALALSESLGDSPGLFKALWGMWLSSSSRAGHQHSLEIAEKLLFLAEQSKDLRQQQQAHHALCNSLLWTGNPSAARAHAEKAMASYLPSQHDAMVSEYGENTYVTTGALLSWALWLQGLPDQAQAVNQQALSVAKQINHPHSLGYVYGASMILTRWMQQVETTRQLAEEAIALSCENGLPLWLGLGEIHLDWALIMQSQKQNMIEMQQMLERVNATMSGAELLFLAPLSAAHMQLGQFEEALVVLNKSLIVVCEKHDRLCESEFIRLKGECLLALSGTNAAEAEICFNQALTVSRQQGAKMLELRAAKSMAKLWRRQAKTAEARGLLEAIYNGFSEGFATPDLLAVSELLQGLG